MKMRDKESQLLNNNEYAKWIRLVTSIIDFECRDNILSHLNNE